MKKLFFFAGMAFGMAACHQNAYEIVGTATGYADGDTMFIANVEMEPFDTLIVKDGQFSMSGQADSVEMGVAYAQKNPDDAVLFFIEPGTIRLTMVGEANGSKVSGTKSNDGLQALTDKTHALEVRLKELGMAFNDTTATMTDEKRQEINLEYAKIREEFPRLFLEAAEQNIDNEFGYFVVTNLAPNLGLDQVTALIGKMPAKFRQRDEVKELEAMLQQANNDNQEQQIEDFTMATPEGTELSVMDEVEQHELTILDFWASWCQPCVREMPNMVALYDAYHDKGLGIIGISLDEDHEQWTKAIKQLGLKWPQISDLKGWNSYAAEMFHVQAIPHMIVVDKNGAILQRGLRGEELSSFIAGQLDEKAAE